MATWQELVAAHNSASRRSRLGYNTGPKQYALYQPRRAAAGSSAPPPGYYDPSIDSQVRAGDRGLSDLLADQSLAATRGANDYATARGDITRGRDESLADQLTNHQRSSQQFDWQRQDLDSAYGRGVQDSQLSEGRLREDYGSALTNLDRSYRRLGANQAQAASAAGQGGGGAFAQALQKRTANEAIDRQPLDTNFNRGLADTLTSRQRMTDDYGSNTGRLGVQRGWAQQDYDTGVRRTTDAADRQMGQLDTQWGRQQQDWAVQADRARRENEFFGQDANQQKWWQAKQMGYTPPVTGRRRTAR